MLPSPQQLSGISTNVRRFNSQLQKEFARQGLRNKHTQRIRLRPAYLGRLTDWMTALCKDKAERQYIIDCVNEQLVGSGWQIVGPGTVERSYSNRPSALVVVLKYRAERDQGLDLDAIAA